MDNERFDALTRRLATTGTSRRRLLRGLGGSVAGAVLTGLGGRGAGAARGGNSAAAHWCAQTYGADTAAASDCTSQAAHGTGPYYTSCASPAGPQCISPQTCGGGGTPGVCGGGCTPLTTCPDLACGTISDGCGGTLACGGCPTGADCLNNTCSCRSYPCTTTADCTAHRPDEVCPGGTGLVCCCWPTGHPNCAPGPNAICCSGLCGADGSCV